MHRPDGVIYYLDEEVVLGTFQEPPGLLTALHATFLEDASHLVSIPPLATAPERQWLFFAERSVLSLAVFLPPSSK